MRAKRNQKDCVASKHPSTLRQLRATIGVGWHVFIGPKSALTNAYSMVNYNRNSVNVWESHMNIKQIHYDRCYYSEYQMSS